MSADATRVAAAPSPTHASARAAPTKAAHTLEYRPQLDGLRALAVVMVFGFHAVPSQLTGGFIGVDVFFVLSGYLITSILLQQADQARRGLLSGFYARRLKRLLPASLTLLLVVALREAVWGSILEAGTRLREITATVLYVANWNLIRQSDDYFAAAGAASPLRHMWSLAVEEQFYLVWPILVVLLVRGARGRRLPLAVCALALAAISALLLSLLYSPTTVTRAYYGTDTRVFQPLLGALLAITLSRRTRPTGSMPSAIPTAGGLAALACIGVMAVRFDGSQARYFHGGAIILGLVTCALIWSLERPTVLTRCMGCAPLAALGRISYGFYLWHWPIILWLRPPNGASWTDRRLVNLAQFSITIAVATASFVLIERPVRVGRPALQRGYVFCAAALAMSLTIGTSDWLLRPPTGGLSAVAVAAADDTSVTHCPKEPEPCVRYDPGNPNAPTVATVGDSTAQMYDPALMQLAQQYGFRYVQGAAGGCPIGDRLIATGTDGDLHKPTNFTCYDAIPDTYSTILQQWPPDLIIATSINEGAQHVTDGELVPKGTPRHAQEMRAALDQALDALTSNGAQVVFLDVLPAGPSVDCLETSAPNAGACVRAVPSPPTDADVNSMFSAEHSDRDSVRGVIDFTNLICPNDSCPLSVDGVVVRYDGRHFTGTWSRSMAPRLDEQLKALGVDLLSL